MTNRERAGIKQERAGRTRALLIQAAGEEFAHRGYAGTSLTRISRAAMATIGALTFHFPAKNELAEAVCERGSELTREAVDRIAAAPHSPAAAVAEITQALAELLEREPVVQAAARLSRELPLKHDWLEAWVPAVRTLLAQAHRRGELAEEEDQELAGALVACVVANLELSVLRAHGAPLGGTWGVRGRLAEVWEVLWYGIAGRRTRPRPGPRTSGAATAPTEGSDRADGPYDDPTMA
ncbi:TetR/AcrR family transcriptional regulator [Streptomyces antimicrobicus]|uniref:TetR family transcriptional regulator n=1 Tax=Streptomyces antimicrobicus TaxID=2883108 RepID=A0ABS8B8M7_9ACTN|nr:TetR/AcrR family transcriptional regulator [Streptomyces antimicrobicus]MCB5180964.1 TetR family transcriptional regulator [Streptomyces antimicrobicus]